MASPPPILVRDARPEDREAIVGFNLLLAEQTEAKRLDPDLLDRGVRRALADPDRLRYWIAERDGRPIGQAAVSREWSDWRDGWIWWLQSVFVEPDSRGLGAFRALHHRIRQQALSSGDVVGLRLYVEQNNSTAQQTYQALGLRPGGYLVFEEIWPDRSASESID